MADLERVEFGRAGYYNWLVKKINGMRKALEVGESFENSTDTKMLKRKLAVYERELKSMG